MSLEGKLAECSSHLVRDGQSFRCLAAKLLFSDEHLLPTQSAQVAAWAKLVNAHTSAELGVC